MIEVIPAIDLIGGQCVRLTQGDYDRKTTYYKDPLDAALRYEECGAGRLHLVDLDGAKASRPANLGVLERIAARTSLEVQYGGGIKSIAVARPDLLRQWLTEFGPERIVLGADTRDGRVAVNGWQEASAIGVEELIGRFADSGLRQVICTDIAKDGMLSGPSVDLYRKLLERFPRIELTASGGIGSWDDIEELDRAGVPCVVVGKAIYEGRIGFDRLETHYGAAER